VVEIADIGDEESLTAWLRDKPRVLAALLAHRAGARVMPFYWGWSADRSTEGDLTDIAMWRILPTSRVRVVYLDDGNGIERLRASGGVTLVSGEDAAEAARADYNLETGIIEMDGDVLLLRGDNALSAERMTVDTRSGTARMSGRVRTVLQPGDEAQ
jgi:hypothetical protein